jgi:hypothetical protein
MQLNLVIAPTAAAPHSKAGVAVRSELETSQVGKFVTVDR